MEYKQKYIAFIDILGFKTLIEESESGDGMTTVEVVDLLSCLDAPQDRSMFDEYGPSICPESSRRANNLDFKITQISDCAVISIEPTATGAVNLLFVCSKIVFRLLKRGLLCRGYITKGAIYHTDNQFFGSGYQKAFVGEAHTTVFQDDVKDVGTPFVELDKKVSDFMLSCGDPCLKSMFMRMVRFDGNCYAIFPFDVFGRVNDPGPESTLEQELESTNYVRQAIQTMKNKVLSYSAPRADVARKIAHYVSALDEQLFECNFRDEMTNTLRKPFLS